MNLVQQVFTPDFIYVVLRVTTPILFATLAVALAQRCGVFNIAVEGMMLISALCGVIFSSYFASSWLGLFFTMLIGILLGLLLGYLVIYLKTDAILAGVAINLVASGGTIFLLYLVSGDRGVSSSINSVSLPNIDLPVLNSIPILSSALNNHHIITYLALLAVPVLHIFLYKTVLGSRIRAVGENPVAAASVGIHVRRTQLIALAISGILASLGGAFLSMGYLSWFTTGMSAGRGYIGLAASAMGGATPIGGFLVSLLFGIADAIANSLQTELSVPYEFVQMIPYITTIVGLAIYSFSKMKKRSLQKEIKHEEKNYY